MNDEFAALESFLRGLPACLKPGGRVAILTFHSGEDRRVKSAFKEGLADGTYASIAAEVDPRLGRGAAGQPAIVASAKLRFAVRARSS